MPYVIPAMPLNINVWQHFIPGTSTYAAPDNTIKACLSPGKRVLALEFALRITGVDGHTCFTVPMELLLPAASRVCAGNVSLTPSVVEVPAGNRVFYWVVYVDDIAKGFANEHRFVLMRMLCENVVFSDVSIACPPFPIP